jgi:dihydroorotase
VHLTDADINFFDSNARVDPPFRSQRDREAIRAGLLDGTIDAMCSDHTPCDDDEKLLPFGEASPGATGLELLLSLAIKWADDYAAPQGKDDALSRAVARVSCEAARVAGLAQAGRLDVGSVADVVVFDPAARWTVTESALASQGKHTPFVGYELAGQVQATLVAGRVAYERNGS